MSDSLTFESNATKAENISAKLAASELFGATIGSANGNTMLSASAQPAGVPESSQLPGAEPSATPAAANPQSAPERMTVPGIGATPPKLPEHAGQTPYQHLADLLGAH